MWRKIRGGGLTYGYNIGANYDEGMLHLSFTKSTHLMKAYKAAKEIIVRIGNCFVLSAVN
jgi:Zn-dependent M16 (insulinase) family peptidase